MGVRVVDCDEIKQERNNDAYDRAREQGYRANKRCNDQDCPLHGKVDGPHIDSNSGHRPQSEDPEDSDSCSDEGQPEMPKVQGGGTQATEAGVRQQPSLSPNVLEPIPGEIYQAYWSNYRCWYPVTVLPWGNLREVGLVGSLDETDLFKEKLPTCFAVKNDPRVGLRIVGWNRDFELHGRRASERKFPCMFFEGIFSGLPRSEEPPEPVQNLAWVMAKHLRPISYRPDGHILKEAGLDEAKSFRERVIMLKSQTAREQSRFSRPSADEESHAFDAREKVSSFVPQDILGMTTGALTPAKSSIVRSI